MKNKNHHLEIPADILAELRLRDQQDRLIPAATLAALRLRDQQDRLIEHNDDKLDAFLGKN